MDTIGSMMSLQAQTTVKPVQVEAPAKSTVEVSSPETQKAAKVDETIRVVESTNQKGSGTGTQSEPSNEQIRKAVEQMNKSMTDSTAVFGIHEQTNRITIKIVDKDTKEIIQEVPPEKTLDMIAKVWEIAGLLVDEKR